ncbi:hypothetical protein T10_8568 [Trichinella papuae]|uniref:Uncharacterized protein n=1 Tax=Trichinella papuae TaxID=268474 RepID=A0A0V1MTA9_9BILA|nr:hypothetical protein T10_8568 [Trichinella papuae]
MVLLCSCGTSLQKVSNRQKPLLPYETLTPIDFLSDARCHQFVEFTFGYSKLVQRKRTRAAVGSDLAQERRVYKLGAPQSSSGQLVFYVFILVYLSVSSGKAYSAARVSVMVRGMPECSQPVSTKNQRT